MRPLVAALLLVLAAGSALAANAEHPDQNVNKANDKGGDTGNNRVEELNRAQSDQAPKPSAPPPAAPK